MNEASGQHRDVPSVTVLQFNFEFADTEMMTGRVDPAAVKCKFNVAAAKAQRHDQAFDASFENRLQFSFDCVGQQWGQGRLPGKAQLGSVAINLILPFVSLDNVGSGCSYVCRFDLSLLRTRRATPCFRSAKSGVSK